MSRIKIIPYQEAEGRLLEIYDQVIAKRGKLANVHTIQSLRPESIVKHIDLYLEIMFSKSDLTRAEREMMAVVVSAANGCEYCMTHHAQALLHYWKDTAKVELLKVDFRKVNLIDRELALCLFAKELTTEPEKSHITDFTQKLRDVGLEDGAILDATLVVSYFNFVNRIVQALGVEIEQDAGKGFKY